jgi:hypothetical protein
MRPLNRIAAAVLGVLLIALGVVAAVELAVAASHHAVWPPWLARWLTSWTTTTIGNRLVFVVAIIVAVVGLLILLLQVRRWRPDRLPTGDSGQGVWWVSRRTVERRARASAGALSGVRRPQADVVGGLRHWRVRVSAEARPEQREPVEESLRRELGLLDLPPEVPVELDLRRPPRRVA